MVSGIFPTKGEVKTSSEGGSESGIFVACSGQGLLFFAKRLFVRRRGLIAGAESIGTMDATINALLDEGKLRAVLEGKIRHLPNYRMVTKPVASKQACNAASYETSRIYSPAGWCRRLIFRERG